MRDESDQVLAKAQSVAYVVIMKVRGTLYFSAAIASAERQPLELFPGVRGPLRLDCIGVRGEPEGPAVTNSPATLLTKSIIRTWPLALEHKTHMSRGF